MNTNFVDKVFRVLLVMGFVLGITWTPGTSVKAGSNLSVQKEPSAQSSADWLPENGVLNPSNGHYYTLTDNLTWQEAEDQARSWRAHLVTIDDQAENDWLVSTFGSEGAYWIGYTDQDDEGIWGWVSGETPEYTNWFQHLCGDWEPNDVGPGEDYATINYGGPGGGCEGIPEGTLEIGPGKWNDVPGTETMSGIAEFVPNPRFSVQLSLNEVTGFEWTLGTNVTLTIDDPSNGEGVDFSETQTVDMDIFEPPFETWVGFWLDDFVVKPGDIVTMTDGNTTKTHITQELLVTDIDLDADTVSGTAAPGTEVSVAGVCDETGCAYRQVSVDANGVWLADFSVPDDEPHEQDIFDLRPGSTGEAQRMEDDGDGTVYQWRAVDPVIVAFVDGNSLGGDDWPRGLPVTATIDDPTNGPGVDFTATQLPGNRPWMPDGTWISFDLGSFDLKPGDLVTYDNGHTVKQHTVMNLTVTSIDLENDTLTGTADPGSEVHVWVDTPFSAMNRHTTTNMDGVWFVDYSIPGSSPDEQDVVDITWGAEGQVKPDDEDGDSTQIGWRVPNPVISARFHENEIHGYEWPLGASVNLTIDDPNTTQPVDYTETQTVVAAEWDPSQTFVSFRLWENDFELENGQTVTMSAGAVTRTHVVAVPIVTAVNESTNIVEGLAGPSAEIWVDLSGATRHEIADATGHWLANFSVTGDEDWETQTTEFGQYMQGEVRFQDEDGNSTTTNWGFPYLLLSLRADGSTYNWIESMGGWPGRSQIFLAVDDPTTPQNPDYTDTTRSRRDDGYAGFDYVDFHDHPGFTITVSNGYMEKTIVVPVFTLTGYDVASDTINGTSSPFETVTVAHCLNEDCSERAERTVVADNEGNWLVNFAVSNNPAEVIYDIQPGDSFDPQIYDEDWDQTIIRWRVPFDSDGDGINDDLDACPDEDASSYDADQDGCLDTAEGLALLVQNLPADELASNMKKPLLAKVNNAIKSLEKGKTNAAIHQLEAFINQVEAQRGKKISEEAADLLIAYAQNVIAQIQ